jgi:hypothetical protein
MFSPHFGMQAVNSTGFFAEGNHDEIESNNPATCAENPWASGLSGFFERL